MQLPQHPVKRQYHGYNRSATYLCKVQLHIAHRRALDQLRRLAHDALGEDDALDREARGPLGHLLADLLGRDGEERLHRVRALAQVEEDHLAPLRARRLHAGAHEHGLPVERGGEVRDRGARAPRPRLGLVQRELAVERGRVVLRVGGDEVMREGGEGRRVRTTSAAAFCASSSACLAAFSAALRAFSSSFARFLSSLLDGPFGASAPSAGLEVAEGGLDESGRGSGDMTHGAAAGGCCSLSAMDVVLCLVSSVYRSAEGVL